jgi:hypothetical protein
MLRMWLYTRSEKRVGGDPVRACIICELPDFARKGMSPTAAENTNTIDLEQERQSVLINQFLLDDLCIAEPDFLCLGIEDFALLEAHQLQVLGGVLVWALTSSWTTTSTSYSFCEP